MKLRIINQNGLFVPQFQKKNYYSNTWNGFGTPVIKFAKKDQAISFVGLIEKSVGGTKLVKKDQVIYTNFKPEGKI